MYIIDGKRMKKT